MQFEKEIFSGLQSVKQTYGADVARTVERMYRLETAHFKSQQFLNTFSAGMEKHNDVFPFGWHCCEEMWIDESLRPIGFWTAVEGHGLTGNGLKKKTFIKFPTVKAAMFAVAKYITFYSPGRWYSVRPTLQNIYTNKLNQIIPKIVNSIK